MNIEIQDSHDSILDSNPSRAVRLLVSTNETQQKDQPRIGFTDEEVKKLSVMVSKSFHKELRLYCAKNECTLTEVVVNAIRDYISNAR